VASDDIDLRTSTWLAAADGRPRELRVRRCRLEVTAGLDAGRSQTFDGERIRIGARRGNDMVLKDPRVSGIHCEIVLDGAGYRLRDLGSRNGTFAAGLRVVEAFITPGTAMQLGDTKLRFEPTGESVGIPLSERDAFQGLMGRSVKMRELFVRLEKLAATDATVLITGETGTGKELAADALHKAGPRAKGPFVVVDCGAIPGSLIESELFGHEKGAYTGADRSTDGAFQRANGGTLFLDEIGELALELQPKLLRVLERKEVRRVGGTRTETIDVRVVAATNRDLAVEVNRGAFREDLYYRLYVAGIHLPPLRDRPEDLPLLVAHFLASIPGGEDHNINPETMELLSRHPWPGNVRELRNVIERAVLLAEVPAPGPAREAVIERSRAPGRADDDNEGGLMVDVSIAYKDAKASVIEQFERRYVSLLLKKCGGNVSRAARIADLDRMTIYKILTRHGIDNPRD